jgi:hypothetical protein
VAAATIRDVDAAQPKPWRETSRNRLNGAIESITSI